MKARTKILFKINNVVVVEESTETLLDTIDKMREIIAEECECEIDDVKVEYEEFPQLSEIDVSNDGMYYWTDPENRLLQGISLPLDEGGDLYLDAISKGNLEDYLVIVW